MRSEVDRYLGWPGQAISYKIGERVWLAARDDARQQHGDAFDLKDVPRPRAEPRPDGTRAAPPRAGGQVAPWTSPPRSRPVPMSSSTRWWRSRSGTSVLAVRLPGALPRRVGHLARVAERTDRIGLGPAVLIPSLRHVLAQAMAIATLESLAPRPDRRRRRHRLHGSHGIGQKPLPWAGSRSTCASCAPARRRAGRGGRVGHADDPARRVRAGAAIEVPILVAANGPRGLGREQLGDGVMTIGSGQPEFDWCACSRSARCSTAASRRASTRALEAAGPALTVVYHGMYEADPAAVDALPGGAEWRAELEGVPESVRHLTVHEDHLVHVTERDAPLLDGHTLAAFTWTGSPNQLRGRLEELETAGATEILYAPMARTSRASCTRSRPWRASRKTCVSELLSATSRYARR